MLEVMELWTWKLTPNETCSNKCITIIEQTHCKKPIVIFSFVSRDGHLNFKVLSVIPA